ncbi:protein tyrosine phosphatase-like protein [Xylariomycetidae sp. FL0641]|nr:protein tyrosine phosphatase-like protein [Xylariomycetidae sp. FL0641]
MTAKTTYLLLYNALSLALWGTLTLRTLLSFFQSSPPDTLYETLLRPSLVTTQSLALLEVPHAALGLVRASPATTALQVGGKNLVVWTVMARFPDQVADSWGFVGCLLAWGFSEVVRYGFFTCLLARGDVWAWLKWLRYSAFVVLYPPGLLSEAWLVYLCLTRAEDVGMMYRAYLFLGLLAYIPAGYVLYTYMLAQRRRALSTKQQ